ncbi:MAG TPA: hypothetical protein V6D19_18730, partial [Stenomitos sp.]
CCVCCNITDEGIELGDRNFHKRVVRVRFRPLVSVSGWGCLSFKVNQSKPVRSLLADGLGALWASAADWPLIQKSTTLKSNNSGNPGW